MNQKWMHYIQKYEGLRLTPYMCATGHLTIGYGHNLERGISASVAQALLQEDVSCAQAEVARNIPWSKQLDEVRQFVLLDMCFNMGISTLLAFQKFLAALKKGDYSAAATEMLNSRWAEQVGRRARELAEMMQTGEYL